MYDDIPIDRVVSNV